MAEYNDFLIVDGYNIINAWPVLNELKEKNLELARDKLKELLVEFRVLKGINVVVVFDAQNIKNSLARRDVIDGVEVIFSRSGETADEVIERLVKKLPKPGNIYVATFDQLEQSLVFGRGAYRITPNELWTEVVRLKKETLEYAEIGCSEHYRVDCHLNYRVRNILEKWRRGNN